jgi:hypothetical protein
VGTNSDSFMKHKKKRYTYHRTDWSSGTAVDLYSRNALLESVRIPAILTEVLRGVPQSLRENARIVPRID